MDNDKISLIVGITGCSIETARFYLESANGNVDDALNTILEANNAQQPANPVVKSRFATMNDIKTPSTNNDDENTYFAGGEKSGVMMKGRPSDKKPILSQDIIKDILQKATENAKDRMDDDDDDQQEPKFFTGAGYSLSSNAPRESSNLSSQRIEQESNEALEKVERRLTFWRNGFSIDDGELLDYEDPKNKKFLELIKSGRAPIELLNVKYGQEVEVKVAHRMEEDYKAPPKPAAKPFSGQGYSLSSPSTSSNAPMNPTTTSSIPPLKIDEQQPITSVQIRLDDGSRLVTKFNHTHTIQDIRNFILTSRPSDTSRRFSLMTTFPSKELTDLNMSIKDAGLLNAAIVQKYV